MGRLNRPAKPGYEYRSPNQTNAEDYVPHYLEDIGASQRADLGRLGRAINSNETPAQAVARRGSALGNVSQRDMGIRAGSRTGVRGGVAAMAFDAGKRMGESLDEAHPEIGDRYINPVIDKVVEKSRNKVELSKDAKRRVKEESDELERIHKSVDTRGDFDYEPTARAIGMKKGGKVTASSRADGCAQRGKTRGRYL
jgi:hypothetical protein